MLSIVHTIVHNLKFCQYKQLQIRAHTREKSNTDQMFDAELANARKLLDEIDIECKRLFEDNADLKYRLKIKLNELNAAQLLDQLQKEKIAKLKGAVEELRKRLDEEKSARIEAESLAEQSRAKPAKGTPSESERLTNIMGKSSVQNSANIGKLILISIIDFSPHVNLICWHFLR